MRYWIQRVASPGDQGTYQVVGLRGVADEEESFARKKLQKL
jgi:hypothetical protein